MKLGTKRGETVRGDKSTISTDRCRTSVCRPAHLCTFCTLVQFVTVSSCFTRNEHKEEEEEYLDQSQALFVSLGHHPPAVQALQWRCSAKTESEVKLTTCWPTLVTGLNWSDLQRQALIQLISRLRSYPPAFFFFFLKTNPIIQSSSTGFYHLTPHRSSQPMHQSLRHPTPSATNISCRNQVLIHRPHSYWSWVCLSMSKKHWREGRWKETTLQLPDWHTGNVSRCLSETDAAPEDGEASNQILLQRHFPHCSQ